MLRKQVKEQVHMQTVLRIPSPLPGIVCSGTSWTRNVICHGEVICFNRSLNDPFKELNLSLYTYHSIGWTQYLSFMSSNFQRNGAVLLFTFPVGAINSIQHCSRRNSFMVIPKAVLNCHIIFSNIAPSSHIRNLARHLPENSIWQICFRYCHDLKEPKKFPMLFYDT